ncbi:Dam family site-specific DNA-(adenine-N6)-methyltransferase [Malacoplasma penetrans]|nr:Dam family site-specific DNA-(adenine-N6)-methyltransferase [Malacoplasma penetrans]
MKMTKRSPFFYVGDKYKIIKQINKFFPKNIKRLIEPFCGGGSVFLNTEAKYYIENDNNYWMIELHKFLCSFKNNPVLFFQKLEDEITKYNLSASKMGITVPLEYKKLYIKTYFAIFNKKAYANVRNDFNKDKSNYTLLYILLIYGFNHMLRFNSKGDFNLPVGNVDYNKNVYNALENYFNFLTKGNIDFKCLDFRTFLKSLEFDKDDFIYLDPPYLITKSEYNKNWTEKDERDLLVILDEINDLGIKFALSNVLRYKDKKNNMLISWSKKYNVLKIKSNYISYHDNSTNKIIDEVLIINY